MFMYQHEELFWENARKVLALSLSFRVLQVYGFTKGSHKEIKRSVKWYLSPPVLSEQRCRWCQHGWVFQVIRVCFWNGNTTQASRVYLAPTHGSSALLEVLIRQIKTFYWYKLNFLFLPSIYKFGNVFDGQICNLIKPPLSYHFPRMKCYCLSPLFILFCH